MRGIRNWSVRTRLLIAFVGVLIPFLALAGIGAVGLQTVSQRLRTIQDYNVMELEGIANLQLAVAQLVMPANDPGAKPEHLNLCKEFLGRHSGTCWYFVLDRLPCSLFDAGFRFNVGWQHSSNTVRSQA